MRRAGGDMTPVEAERHPLYAVGKARLGVVEWLITSRGRTGHASPKRTNR